MKKLILALAAFGLSSVAMAGPAWTYVDLGYVIGDSDEEEFGDGDTSGYLLRGSIGLGGLFHVQASYSDTEIQDIEFDGYGISVGVHPALSDSTDLFVDIGYDTQSFDGSDIDMDTTFVATGLRSMITDNFELNARVSINAIDIDTLEDQTDVGFGVGGQYFFNDNIGVGIDWSRRDVVVTDDYGQIDFVNLYVRWSFGDLM